MSHPTAPGQLDPSFANQGRFSHEEYDHLGPIAVVSSSQQILITSAPRRELEITILRLNPDGSLDQNFGAKGISKVTYEGALRVFLTAITVDESQRIFLLGDYNVGPDQYHPFVLRLHADGRPDTGFGEHGRPYRVYNMIDGRSPRPTPAATDINSRKTGLASNAPQQAHIEGDTLYFSSRDHIVAINLNGELQLRFNQTGYWKARHSEQEGLLGGLAPSNGKLIAAVAPLPTDDYQDHTYVLRLDQDGNVDTGFAENGYLRITTKGHTLLPKQLKASASGAHFTLLCATDINFVNEGTALASFTSAGQLNNQFNDGLPLILNKPEGHMASPTGLGIWQLPEKEEKLYLSLDYLDEEDRAYFKTVRLNANGTADNTYGEDGWATLPGPAGLASELACQHDGKLLVAANIRLPEDPKNGLYVVRLLA
ncbi:hypothetical protein [Pseudomonas sp. UM16]|uniref:hypothetical protein n=1 Tax=Pseudomonas sp. UM16 TaxID=3158962 RepID=UPI00398FCAE8